MTDTSGADAFLALEEKGINYLLIANGAGLASCLATLKDYASTPQLKGIGFLIAEFGLGVLLAALGFILLQVISVNMRPWDDKTVGYRAMKIIVSLHNSVAIASMGCFAMAILTIMNRLKDL